MIEVLKSLSEPCADTAALLSENYGQGQRGEWLKRCAEVFGLNVARPAGPER